MLDRFRLAPFHPQNWIYSHTHTHPHPPTHTLAGVGCLHIWRLDDLEISKQPQRKENTIFKEREREGKRKKKKTELIWRRESVGPKQMLELIQCLNWSDLNLSTNIFFTQKKNMTWGMTNFNLSSIWTYPTSTSQAWTAVRGYRVSYKHGWCDACTWLKLTLRSNRSHCAVWHKTSGV